MSISEPFIPASDRGPTAADGRDSALAGRHRLHPAPGFSPLPQSRVSPTINVNSGLPGASPETMASAVATPLERQFGRHLPA